MKKLYVFLAVLALFSACEDPKDKDVAAQYLPLSGGKVNMIAVVMDGDQWEGRIGDSIRSIYGVPTDGLPMIEPIFSLRHIKPEVFKKQIRTYRSVIIAQTSDKKMFKIRKNVYSKPQRIVYVGGTEDEIVTQLSENAAASIKILKENELFSKQEAIRGSLNQEKTLEETFGISLNIPSVYKMVKKEDNFVWFERKVKNGTMNIIAYALPLGSIPKDDTTIDAIIKMRDSIGKTYVPGRDPETMYMITEKAYTPFLYEAEVDSKFAFETKGMWEVYGFHMAGPFINYVVEDKEHDRLMVIEGFTFAPSEDKRDFMFEIEAILKSLKVNK
ncbi:DUF4837 family protein [Kordia sp.]|uniref:DUF4837 family protein n=1 Tax=Kordia sp. TaxID=1965332 RepID=UPI0025BE8D56|nr:DUF4837 family protein [Kordia sp.]MCH2193761.1 DUF4837 family protein [Kordia sp.]